MVHELLWLTLDKERGGIFVYSGRVGRYYLVGKIITKNK